MTVPADPFPWADPALHRRLLADPAAVLKDYGVNLPDGLPAYILHDVARIVSLLWVDGQIVPREQFHIDPADHGLLFGRGVWTSTRTFQGVPWLWSSHVERMVESAKRLDIELPAYRLPDANAVTAYVRLLAGTDVIVRVNATAGRPGKAGIVWMSAAVLPYPMASYRLRTCPTAVRPEQAFLVWKTFQYASRLRVTAEATKAGFDSALMIDAAGNVQEAAHANIFFRFPDGWVTPPADDALFLPGTVRRHLLANAPVKIAERAVPLAEVGGATEVFVTNSNVGLVPVTLIDAHEFKTGPDTEELAKWLTPEKK